MEILDVRVILPALVTYKDGEYTKEAYGFFDPRTLEVATCGTPLPASQELRSLITDFLKTKPGKWFVPPVPDRGFENMSPKSFMP